MAHAWLDSLSEDWVSQPGSDASDGQLPPLPPLDEVETPQIKQFPSRIPRRSGNRSSLPPTSDNSPNVLSERSANDINISMKRLPSKLSQEVKADMSRSASNETNGSVVHNRAPSQQSPDQNGGTPEWKRRLVYGEVPYGEQRDLFCSAAVGLQDMFKPPQEGEEESKAGVDESQHVDMTMPSSPPTYPQPITEEDLDEYPDFDEDDEFAADVTPSPSPRRLQKEIKYRLNESSPIPGSRRTNQTRGDHTPEHEIEDEIYLDDSCLTAPHEDETTSRKPSGQSDTQHEEFSPILIGKHSGENGNIDFAPIEVPVDQLWQKLECLRINQMLLDSQADLQAGFDTSPRSPANIETTEDYMQNGGFINVRRGGRSGDGSFYRRGLSSEIGVDTSEMLPEESLQASTPKQFPSVRNLGTNPYPTFQVNQSPSLPRAPFPSPDKKQLVPEEALPAGNSPLKLFGPYDTFTNQTLLRRISQFEERSGSPSQRSTTSHNPDHDDHDDHDHDRAPSSFVSGSRNISRFGGGDLDGFEFHGEHSDEIYEDSDAVGKENVAPNEPSLPAYPLREVKARDPSPDRYSGLVVDRKRSKNETPSRGRNGVNPTLANGAPSDSGTPKRDPGSESKRPRTSPSKDPTPKRRRTLHRSDIAFGRETKLEAVDAAHLQMHSLLSSKKRKDALPGNFEVADPSIMALRSVLQPRSPTSSRSSSASYDHAKRSPRRDAQNDLPTPPSDAPTETDRKPSIRTQDFVDQAAQIMAMIRNQVRPELASLEESEEDVETEVQLPSDVDSCQDSTSEPFSRPPSREGNTRPWVPPRQDDPELIDRLKKYQEFSDMGDVISSSVRSMGLAQNAVLVAQDLERQIDGRNQQRSDGMPIPILGEVISDLPNVRITTNPLINGEQRSPSRDYPSNSSNRSNSQTYPSASSRGSESRRTIMQETVSHLIPDRVGSMCLDKDKNVWIKRKESLALPERNVLPSDDSEDDPFASIPDLSVDMTRELHHLRLVAAGKEPAIENPQEQSSPKSPSRRAVSRGYVTLSPTQQMSPRASAFMSKEIDQLEDCFTHQEEHVVGEPEAFDDRESNTQSSTKRRNLTISFSSPIASIIRDLSPEDLDSIDESDVRDDINNDQASPHKSPSETGSKLRKGAQNLRGNTSQAPLRQASLRGPAFIPRPVSRIDEQDEESTVELANEDRQLSIIGEQSMVSHKTPDGRRASLSFIFNQTPGNGALTFAAEDNAMIGRNVGKLSLSPLSEFTLNNPDQSFGFEVSYVMGPRHMATGDGSKKVLSMTIRDLVARLSEAEPHESFWEDLTELDLRDTRLASLHMLDEFCGKLVTLDVSGNRLNHLDGVPSSIRELKVSQNMLTELTSWDHLMNLQYVDISGNEVTSLSALKNLVHLRSIKADNNQLTSLDGLDTHDGLLSLRARNNMIEEVDFSVSRFERLEELDLGGNQISSVHHVDMLPALARLKLSKNRLTDLPKVECMKSLRHLDMSDNELLTLDMSTFPNLHSMHADRNHINQVFGFERARRLDSLSLREQKGDIPLDLGFLSSAYEVRKLFLSGNYLQQFNPEVDFLNMQLLELSNCGLQRLPDKIGQLMPNLRTLNVNFNALSNLSPLQFIPRLKKLLVAGNRLADSTLVTQLLTEFPHLTQLDVRDNPVTLGFYAPLQVLVPTNDSGFTDPFILPDADAARDETFARRLDQATRLRRRLHQVVLVASCRRLRMLDGLSVRRRDVLARDQLLQTLIDDGLVPDPEHPVIEEKGSEPLKDEPQLDEEAGDEETMADEQARAQLEDEAEAAWQQNTTLKSSRWGREDSFA